MMAARELDWEAATANLDGRTRMVIRETAAGTSVQDIAKACKVTAPRVVQVKRQAGDLIRQAWDLDPMVGAVQEAGWEKTVRSNRETRSCRILRRRRAA